MKKNVYMIAGLSALMALTGCKSKESAWVQAYNKASQNVPTTNATEVEEVVEVTPVAPRKEVKRNDYQPSRDADVRTIDAQINVVSGQPLKSFSVIVGSFTVEANALGLRSTLVKAGHDARVVKTNETINGHTGWYRVVAESYNDKGSALQSRNSLKGRYPGAWLLYTK